MSQPSSEGEKILYRVLEKASLTTYYSAFVTQGGDDVQQLCEAGEEEFLEIMALVGMATKPLQVRRLQKALQEWLTSPHLFFSDNGTKEVTPAPAKGSILDAVKKMGFSTEGFDSTPLHDLQIGQPLISQPLNFSIRQNIVTSSPRKTDVIIKQEVPIAPKRTPKKEPAPPCLEPMWKSPDLSPASVVLSNGVALDDRSLSATPPSLESSLTRATYSPSPPVGQGSVPCIGGLSDEQIESITLALEEILPQLPKFEVKRGRMKKVGNKEALKMLDMDPTDPLYLPLLRKYSAIYGRFDCKRKIDKPMCLHEYYVNEASFQLCQKIPELISRRNELFPIARAVVRKSGYKFTKGKSRAQVELLDRNSSNGTPRAPSGKMVIKKESNGTAAANSPHTMPEPTSSNASINYDSEDPSLSTSDPNDPNDMDHNLRLLKAYGMYEMASELKKNNGGTKRQLPEEEEGEEDSDIDEQEEWNKQIEEDSKILNANSGSESNSPAKKLKV